MYFRLFYTLHANCIFILSFIPIIHFSDDHAPSSPRKTLGPHPRTRVYRNIDSSKLNRIQIVLKIRLRSYGTTTHDVAVMGMGKN